MLNSIFLATYSPVLIIFNFIFGIILSEKAMVFKKLSLPGIIIFAFGTLLLYDRLNTSKEKNSILQIACLSIFISYIMICFTSIRNFKIPKILSYFLFSLFFSILTWIVSDKNISNVRTQYNILGALGIVFAITKLLPGYRKNGDIFNFSTLILSLSFSIFVFTNVEMIEKSNVKKTLN